jgi:hypothetical protein
MNKELATTVAMLLAGLTAWNDRATRGRRSISRDRRLAMDQTARRVRAEQIARRREQLAAGRPVTQDDVRRATQRNEEAYDSAAAAHDRAARAHDRAAEGKGGDTTAHEAAAAQHRASRDADEHAATAARARRSVTTDL